VVMFVDLLGWGSHFVRQGEAHKQQMERQSSQPSGRLVAPVSMPCCAPPSQSIPDSLCV
jgi:hypothetical protein